MTRAALLILGMHRSGTSALTWLASRLGAALPGDAIDAHADNARGYFESAGLVAADDQLLRVAGSSWFDPRPLDLSRLDPSALRSRQDRMGEAIERGWGDAPLLAIKDPRQCRFVPVVAEVLAGMDVAPRAVLMLRDPAEIARSVERRDGTSAAFAHLLWLRHMVDAERATRAMPRAIVSFADMLADWRGTMRRLAPLAGRPDWQPGEADVAEIDRFLDPTLRHHRQVAPAPLMEPLGTIVAAVADGLQALLDRDDPGTRDRLDQAYARLDREGWLEGHVVHDELRHRRMPASTGEEASPEAAPEPPPPAAAPPPPRPIANRGEDARIIRESGLFDGGWYLATYPDAAASGLDPVDHYLAEGAARGYRPHPLFDTGYYARQMARRQAAGE